MLLVATSITVALAAESPKTLARVHDAVVVPTGELGDVPDRQTGAWRLYRFENDVLGAIPFQFDPIDTRGDVEVDAPADFAFDANDQLVFMAKDSGDRATQGAMPSGSDLALELEIADPVGEARGWVYLVHFAGPPPPPATERYVTFDLRTNRGGSSLYQVEYAPTRNFFTGLRITPEAGGSGRNLLRQTRMLGRPTFHLLFADLTLRFTEQNSVVAFDGLRTGPVRAVRRVRLSVDLGSFFPTLPSGTVYTHHYRTFYTTPSRVGIPRLVLKALRAFCFENVVDFAPETMPMRYWDDANRQGVGWTEPGALPRAIDNDHDWWVHSGADGTMLHAFVIPGAWREWGIVRGTAFRAGSAQPMPSACAGDGTFAAGYTLLNMTNLRASGDQQFLLADVVLPNPYTTGDEVAPMAMLRAPLRTAVHRMPGADVVAASPVPSPGGGPAGG